MLFRSDTAMTAIGAIGATYLRVLGERGVGIVESLVKLGSGLPVTLITKAGGFGEEDAILRALHREGTL